MKYKQHKIYVYFVISKTLKRCHKLNTRKIIFKTRLRNFLKNEVSVYVVDNIFIYPLSSKSQFLCCFLSLRAMY